MQTGANIMGQPKVTSTRPLEKGAIIESLCPEAPANNDKHDTGKKYQGVSSKSTWHHLFGFTTRRHAPILTFAVIAAVLVAATKTLYAILLGRIMDIVSPLGAGAISGNTAMEGVKIWCLVLTGVGVAIWASNWALMALWIIFGEVVAKSVRESLFTSLLSKEMAWFDRQEEGVSSVLSTIHM